jgi:hypothetical protein
VFQVKARRIVVDPAGFLFAHSPLTDLRCDKIWPLFTQPMDFGNGEDLSTIRGNGNYHDFDKGVRLSR